MSDAAVNSWTKYAAVETAAQPSRLEDEVIALFDDLRAPLLRYLLSFRLAVPEAEEIVQDVFLALFRHLQAGKSRSNLRGWVFRVAHNSALKSRSRTRRDAGRNCDAVDLPDTPEDILAARQLQEKLLSVMRALPEQDQCCLSLRAEGLRYREIAEVLGISLGSVAASLQKSLAKLQRGSEA